jgi:O-antigen/teichoic acid export membrane protein
LTLARWGTRGILSIVDQGLVSGSNFALSILYARWLAADDYGRFAVLFGIFLLASSFHNAMLLEPMSVLGPARNDVSRRGYIGDLVVLHFATTFVVAAILSASGGVLWLRNAEIGRDLAWLAAALPVILLFWLLRRVCYLSGDSGRAARSSLVYAAVMLALVQWKSAASPAFAFAAMAFAGGAASLTLFRRGDFEKAGGQWRRLLREHWRYGRWVVAVAPAYWATGAVFGPLAGALIGLSNAATMRAAENLLQPLNQVLTAITLLILPWLSGSVANKRVNRLRLLSRRASFAGAGLALIYASALLVFGRDLVAWVYPGGSYQEAFKLLPIFCAAAVVRSASDLGASLTLRARARPDVVFWATAAGAVVGLIAGVVLIKQQGIRGAAWAGLLATTIRAAVLSWAVTRITDPPVDEFASLDGGEFA